MTKQRIANPFSSAVVPAPDGVTYRYVDPRYGEFARLTTDEKRQEYLDRIDQGLLPTKKPDVALSEAYRNRKSHALDLSRWIKFNTNDGRTLADFWMSIINGTNQKWTDIKLEHALEASRLMATHGFARFAPVDEKGAAVTPEGSNGQYTGRLLELLLAKLAAGRATERSSEGSGDHDAGATRETAVRLVELGKAEPVAAEGEVDNVADPRWTWVGEDKDGS